MWDTLRQNLAVTRRQYQIYLVLYLLWGFTMNSVGKILRIAEFATWWQVFTCYGLYLVPASLLVRRYSLFQQYLYGLLTLAPLELAGYALGTSHAYPGNVLDKVLGERNFTLAMVLFFAAYFPLLNALVSGLHGRLFRPQAQETVPPDRGLEPPAW